MTHTTRLLIAVGLALTAAIVNYLTMQSAIKPAVFVKVNRNLQAGDTFSVANLERLEIPAGFVDVEETAIPFDRHGVLLGRPAQRDFRAGDIVFWRDSPERSPKLDLKRGEEIVPIALERVEVVLPLLRIGNEVSFRYVEVSKNPNATAKSIGPFRIVGIGNRLGGESDDKSDQTKVRMITVAVNGDDPENAKFFDNLALEKVRLLRVEHRVPASALQKSRP